MIVMGVKMPWVWGVEHKMLSLCNQHSFANVSAMTLAEH
jgi:hypothetical protein